MNCCIECGKNLTYNEVGIYKKLINRDSNEFMCKKCLAEMLKVPETVINKKIDDFKRMGCTLFI